MKVKGNFFSTMNSIRADWAFPKELFNSIPNYVFKAKSREQTADQALQITSTTLKKRSIAVKNSKKKVPERSVSVDHLSFIEQKRSKVSKQGQLSHMQPKDDSNDSFTSQHELLKSMQIGKPSHFAAGRNTPTPGKIDSLTIFTSEPKKKVKKMINSSYFKKGL